MALARQTPELTSSGQADQEQGSFLVLPDKAIPKDQIPAVALHLCDGLREFTDSLTAYVMLKQAGEIIKSAMEQDLDHAIVKMQGKEMECFGATVSLRSLKEYEYNDPSLREWERQTAELKEKIDNRKKFMKLIKTPQADGVSGEIVEPAKLIRDGSTLAVKFK